MKNASPLGDGAEALTKFDIKFGLALCIKSTSKTKPTADNGGLNIAFFFVGKPEQIIG